MEIMILIKICLEFFFKICFKIINGCFNSIIEKGEFEPSSLYKKDQSI